MTQARVQKARRLLELQRSLQRLEEGRIAGLQGRQTELASLQEELVNTLNTEEGLRGLFVPMIVRRLQSLGDESGQVSDELARRLTTLQTLAGRTKCAERRSRNYEEDYARAQAEKELLEIIERLAGRKDASLP
jgi:hypothetical protein